MTHTELATDGVAVAAIASPWWLPVLQSIHDWAAWILPILGVAWLLLQAYTHFRRYQHWKRGVKS